MLTSTSIISDVRYNLKVFDTVVTYAIVFCLNAQTEGLLWR